MPKLEQYQKGDHSRNSAHGSRGDHDSLEELRLPHAVPRRKMTAECLPQLEIANDHHEGKILNKHSEKSHVKASVAPPTPYEKEIARVESKINHGADHSKLSADARKEVEKLEHLIFTGRQDELVNAVREYKDDPLKLASIASHVRKDLEPYGLSVACKTYEPEIAGNGGKLAAALVINNSEPAGYQLRISTDGQIDVQHTYLYDNLYWSFGVPNVLKHLGESVTDNIDKGRKVDIIRPL